jgi:hypothetical protein
MEISNVDRSKLEAALISDLKDFEDALQIACASLDRLDAIVTRNMNDFRGANLPIFSVDQLVHRL